MYLHKIISSGFKSFADKITLHLQPHEITGMIGPNGSGKSNIIDGVRWVMGEQSTRNLRGDRSTDLIFSGSHSRKSLGMAEVTLVFNNSSLSSFCPPEYRHHPEITLTRRVYRDGSKEALINGQRCRLKDLMSFFESAGMGGRSYSIIQQGQVGQILKAKPFELRQMIEEMAGVLEFQKKKQQAQKNMKQTRQNLDRVLDLLEELTTRKEILQEQAQAAHKYEQLQKDIRHHELVLLAYDLREAQRQKQHCGASSKELVAEIQECSQKLGNQEHHRARLKEQLSNVEDSLSSLQEQITLLRERMAGCESSLSHLDTLQHQYKDQEGELLSALEADRRTLLEYKERLAHKLQEYKEAEVTYKSEQSAWKVLEREKKEGEREKKLLEKTLKEQSEKLEAQRKNLLTQELTQKHVLETLSKNSEELSTLSASVQEAQRILQTKTIDGESYGLRYEREKAHHLSESKKCEEERSKEAQCAQKKEQLLKQEQDLLCQQAALKSQRTLLSELKARRQQSLQALRESLKQASPSLQFMADGVSLKDKVLLTAEALRALDEYLQRLTVVPQRSTEEILGVVGQLLETESQTSRRPLRLSLQESSGECDHQGALEAFYPRYLEVKTPAWVSVVQNLYYCSHPLEEVYSADLFRDKVVVFSSGVVLAYGKELTVPGGEDFQGALYYERELASVDDALKQLLEKLEKVKQGLEKLSHQQKRLGESRRSFEKSVYESQCRLSEELVRLRSFEATLEGLKQDYELRQQRLQKTQDHSARLKERHRELSEQRQDLLEEIPELEKQCAQSKEDLGRLESDTAVRRQAYERSQLAFTAADSKAQVLEKSTMELKAYITSLESREKDKEDRLIQERDDFKTAQESRQELQEEIAVILQKRSEKEGTLAQMKESYDLRKEEFLELDEKTSQLRSHLTTLKLAGEKNQGLLRQATQSIQALREEVRERFQREPEELPTEDIAAEFERKQHVQQIQSWKAGLGELGAINFVAQKEYDDLLEREDFLSSQKQELEDALAVLTETIKESERMGREKFHKTFHRLSDEFRELFPILFPGGQAELELVAVEGSGSPEEEETSDAAAEEEEGVEIMVQLPGKRRQPLNLFSGGEKALTAIALIFSFLKTKPTPFCLLDEVDAPLDEANVARYNALLQALQERFQFLVITHNRKTMEVFDVLYGITMQEPGVSKIVGVDLEQGLPAHLKKKRSSSVSALAPPRPRL